MASHEGDKIRLWTLLQIGLLKIKEAGRIKVGQQVKYEGHVWTVVSIGDYETCKLERVVNNTTRHTVSIASLRDCQPVK
jgi:hypothetical protein